MSTGPSAYHRRVASDKRAAILAAAMALFAESGYASTPLARVADAADVSKATLFKQFPTKDELFAAIVTDYWETGSVEELVLEPGEPEAGLTVIGRRYADLLAGDEMAGLFRMVIAEAPRFPELARIQFDLGKRPFFDHVRRYLEHGSTIGALVVEDSTSATTQFLGMISNHVLWPRMLLVDWELSSAEVADVVEQAVATMLARYLPPPRGRTRAGGSSG